MQGKTTGTYYVYGHSYKRGILFWRAASPHNNVSSLPNSALKDNQAYDEEHGVRERRPYASATCFSVPSFFLPLVTMI